MTCILTKCSTNAEHCSQLPRNLSIHLLTYRSQFFQNHSQLWTCYSVSVISTIYSIVIYCFTQVTSAFLCFIFFLTMIFLYRFWCINLLIQPLFHWTLLFMFTNTGSLVLVLNLWNIFIENSTNLALFPNLSIEKFKIWNNFYIIEMSRMFFNICQWVSSILSHYPQTGLNRIKFANAIREKRE